jgi:translocation and assembly module TamB
VLPHVAMRQLLAVLGNTQVAGGTLDGEIDLAGTISRPTATADVVARDLAVPPDSTAIQVQAMHRLRLVGTWDGAAGSVNIDGDGSGGGSLRIALQGRADAPQDIGGTLEAHDLDLAPLVALAPGPAAGIAGRLDARLDFRGIDPRTVRVGGQLHVRDGRIPIAPTVGTLFHADLQIELDHHVAKVAASGKLGRGDVKLVGTAPIDDVAPVSGQLELTFHRVQLIGATQPIVDGTVNAQLGRTRDGWRANLDVRKALVTIPEDKGEKLKPVGAPPDLIYRDRRRARARGGPPTPVHGARDATAAEPQRQAPDHPALVADIVLRDTKVEAQELRGNVSGKLRVLVGGGQLGVIGTLELEHGNLDLFGRRYTVDRAALRYDGSTDPELDVRITHDFPDVTTITEVRGRMSKPQLALSSQPSTYTESELLGFLLGGEPGGDPNMAPSARERVQGAAASLVASKIASYVKRALPIDIDVLRYESASAMSSAAVTVGTWITHDLFLAYRRRLDARPDENAGEGEIEYWLQRRLSLTGTVGDRGYHGIDLLWRRRW